MDVKDTARYLKLNHMTVYKMAQQGNIPAFKVGGAWRFKREVLDDWLTQKSPGRPKRALAVDDEPVIAELIRRLVSEHGFEVTTAGTGQAALDAIESGPFDVIFLDLVLPDMNGTEVLRRIKEVAADTVVAIVTGHAEERVAIEAMELGPALLIRKPFKPDDIASVLKMAGAKVSV
jgi:excisionase family DNA binding protein